MGVCSLPLMGTVCDAVDFANNPAGAITNGIGAWIAESLGDLAASGADLAAKAVNATTAIDLNAPWFRNNYEMIMPIGLVLVVGTLCLQLVLAAWRRDERALAQALYGTVTGVFFMFCAVSFTAVAVTVVDALSNGLFSMAGTSISSAVRRIIDVSELGPMFQLGWAIPSFVALGCAIGAFMYWAVMVARKVGVLVLVTLAVFAAAGGGWDAAKRWRRGWIEATATLVFSKLVMTIVFLLGVSAMGNTSSSDGLSALSDALAGLTIMVMILLCPYSVYKFVHWASESGGHDDLHRGGVAGVATAVGAAKTAGSLAMQAGLGKPAGPAKIPGAGADGVASGIDPAGSRLSKEGIDPGPETTASRFRFGETRSDGDRGFPLVNRPGIPALITRRGDDSGGGSSEVGGATGSAQAAVSASPPSAPAAQTGSGAAPIPPAIGPEAPPASGGPTPARWAFPQQPPSD